MLDTAVTTGSMVSTPQEKARLALESLAHNCKNAAFKKLFPERVEEHARNLENSKPPSPPAPAAAPPPQAATGSAQSLPQQDAFGVGAQQQQQEGNTAAQLRQQARSNAQDMDFTMSGLRLG